ncbi:MAG: class I SAM-dependent methyltransferase [Actinobacteria bacterium]|nr:class I SAM-dependent methyltransferase [Actinomycetota bacterium]
MSAADPSDPSRYGRAFADVYDQWYSDSFETNAAVEALTLMASGGSVLELGVGTGRLAIPLAQRGLRIVGLDASPEMLDQLALADHGQRVIRVLGDMADAAAALARSGINERFSAVFCAFNTLLNLVSLGDVTHCFETSRSLLTAEGKLVIEAFVPVAPDSIPPNSLSPANVNSDAAVFIETTYNSETSVLSGRHIEVRPGALSIRPWSVLICGPLALDEAAATAGLVLHERWSDWAGAAFTENSTAHISIYTPDTTF